MYCSRCGHQLNKDANFCSMCKHPVYSNLIQKAKNRNEDAISILISQTKNRLYFTALKYVKNEAIAEDIVQESYISAFQKLEQLSLPSKFESWMVTIVANRCLNHLEVKKNTEICDFSSMESTEEQLSFEENIQDERLEFSPEDNFNYEELKQGLNEVLDELPDKQRMAIILYYLDELKVKEVAEVLQISEGSVKSCLNYGRKAIKEKIEELRKHNKSFFSIAPIPFMVWMLNEQVKASTIEIKAAEVVRHLAPAIPGQTVLNKFTGSSIKNVPTVATKSMVTKVALGTFSAAVITTGVIGGYTVYKNNIENGTSKVNEITQDKTTQYEVLNQEVPNFEMTPIDNDEKDGYIVEVDGKYGFIDTDVSYLMEPIYDSVVINDLSSSSVSVCMATYNSSTFESSSYALDYYIGQSDSENCSFSGGSGGFPSYFVDPDENVLTLEIDGRLTKVDKIENSVIAMKIDKYEGDSFQLLEEMPSLANGEKYIVTKNNKVFGPYDSIETPSFGLSKFDNIQFFNLNPAQTKVKELFYEKEKDGYQIWNAEGNKKYDEIFDSAIPISNNAMKVSKDGEVGVINEDLELVLWGKFEDVTNPINNKAFVKVDGEWKLIKVKENVDAQEDLNITKLKSAYQSKIEELNVSDLENWEVYYSLYDINNDGIVELIVKTGTGEANYKYSFFTYDEKCVSLGELSGSQSALEIDPEGKGILHAYGHMGYYQIERIIINKNNEIETEWLYDTNNEKVHEEYIPYYKWPDKTGFDELK